MELRKIDNLADWNRLVLGLEGDFAQSFQWGEVAQNEGKKIERLAVFDGEKPKMACFGYYNSLLFGWRYFFSPKGPVGDCGVESLNCLMDYLKTQKIIFWRLEPAGNMKILDAKKSLDINPRATIVLDLTKTEEKLFAEMRPKTRYNIRLAEKKHLEIKTENNLDIFLELMKKTAARDNFRTHKTEHYRAIFSSNFCKQFTAYFEKKSVATILLIGFGKNLTYLFGASDYNFRQLMAPFLLQLEAIKYGQQNGFKQYDLFGVAPKISADKYDEKHQYAGVTRFKAGFGGQYQESAGTLDLIIKKVEYTIYQWLRKIRRLF